MGSRARSALRSAAVVTAFALALASGAPSGARSGYWKRTSRIAPGVTWTRINLPGGPNRVHVVSIKLAKPSTIDVMLADDRLPGFEFTSSMARRAGAIAAINGDYALPSGRPVLTFARDGRLEQTQLTWGRNFALDRTETRPFIGFARTRAWLTDIASGTQMRIDKVNAGAPADDEVALFTPVGGDVERPPKNSCSARLYATGAPRVRTPEPGVTEDVYVEAVKCAEARLWPQKGIVVSTPIWGPRAAEISSLLAGQQLTLSWTLKDLVDVVETIGGNPTLVENGQIVAENVTGSGGFFSRHPRTGVGTTPDGRVLFVTVDGRQKGYSVGMTLARFARLFQDLGADWALNLDGGGSTTMWVDGKVRNRPSDGTQRGVSSALVLLPGSDGGESGLGAPADGGSPLPSPGATWERIAADPASTGGLFDALQRRGIRLPSLFGNR